MEYFNSGEYAALQPYARRLLQLVSQSGVFPCTDTGIHPAVENGGEYQYPRCAVDVLWNDCISVG